MSALTALEKKGRHLWSGLEAWFFAPADPRAYAALRIGFSLAAFSVLVDYWPYRYALLAKTGLFGGALGVEALPILDVFTWARSETAVTAVFVVSALAIVSLGLGVFQRAAAIVTYFWAASYCSAGGVAQSGFDAILRVVGFVLAISPAVHTWSLSKRHDRSAPPVYGLRLVQWQLMLIYVTTAWLKAPDEFWRRGDAIPYFLMSAFSRFPSPVFAHLGVLGGMLTFGTIVIEVTVPFLLWMRKTRWLGVALGLSLHVGIAVTSKLALFSIAILCMYPAFFEQRDFDALAGLFGRKVADDASG